MWPGSRSCDQVAGCRISALPKTVHKLPQIRKFHLVYFYWRDEQHIKTYKTTPQHCWTKKYWNFLIYGIPHSNAVHHNMREGEGRVDTGTAGCYGMWPSTHLHSCQWLELFFCSHLFCHLPREMIWEGYHCTELYPPSTILIHSCYFIT